VGSSGLRHVQLTAAKRKRPNCFVISNVQRPLLLCANCPPTAHFRSNWGHSIGASQWESHPFRARDWPPWQRVALDNEQLSAYICPSLGDWAQLRLIEWAFQLKLKLQTQIDATRKGALELPPSLIGTFLGSLSNWPITSWKFAQLPPLLGHFWARFCPAFAQLIRPVHRPAGDEQPAWNSREA